VSGDHPIETADLGEIASLFGDSNTLENGKSLNCCGLPVSLTGDVDSLSGEICVDRDAG